MKLVRKALYLTGLVSACTTMNNPTPPLAKQLPHELSIHGDTRIDPFYWLNERENPEVVDYLTQENAYTQQMLAHTKPLQETLFQEIKGRIKEDDQSVPYLYNGYYYYTRYEVGKEYPIHCRKKESLTAPEEILLNVNELAEGHDYYQVGSLNISPDNKLLAYSVDTVSRRIYTIYFKNLETGELLVDQINNATPGFTWANTNQHGFYTTKDATLRACKIHRHTLGSAEPDPVVFHEADETFNVGVSKTKSREYLIIASSSTVADEFHYLSADNPLGEWKVFQARERGLEYGIEHFEDHWYIRTNYQKATNFKLMKCPLSSTTIENWQDVVPHRDEVLLEGIEIFKDYLVLDERSNGLSRLYIKPWNQTSGHYMEVAEETYSLGTGINPEFNTSLLRYQYTSLTTPSSTLEYHMEKRTTTVLKEQEIPGGYDKSRYASERVWATAADGKKVAMSLVYRKDLRKPEGNPTLIYGYGSYGYTIDAGFSVSRLSLLDRGFVYAIAHIRGGEYLGRQWYEDGKMLNKKNTFTDFIACSEHLLANNYAAKNQLFAMGGSAGGLLMGAVINMRPDLYKAVVAAVPFVDVVTTMLDESIPLTTGEFDEWGNPKEKVYYNYMLEYSPYDQVKPQDYPAMLVTTGLHDSQVQYWEPAKWVAKLRITKTDNNPLLLHCNMETGHGGASGRFEALKEVAMEYAFILDLAGVEK